MSDSLAATVASLKFHQLPRTVDRRTRLSTIGDRALPVAAVEHSVGRTERLFGAITDCFRKRPEHSSLQSFLPQSPVMPAQ